MYGRGWVYWERAGMDPDAIIWNTSGWEACVPEVGNLRHAALSWLYKGPEGGEIAGIGAQGQVYHSEIRLDSAHRSATTRDLWAPSPHLAVAISRPGHLAAVTSAGVLALRRNQDGLRCKDWTHVVSLPTAVACFTIPGGKEVIVVCADGTLVRLPFA